MSNLLTNIITFLAPSYSTSSIKKEKSITMSSSNMSVDPTENLKQETKSKSESSGICPGQSSKKVSKSHASMGTMLTSIDFLGNKYTFTNCVKCNQEFRRMSLDKGKVCAPCDIEGQLDGTNSK